MAATIEQLRNNTAGVAAYTGKQGQIVINTDDNSIHVQDGSTAAGHRLGPDDAAHVESIFYQAPTTGFSITAPNAASIVLLDPAGTLASGTVTMSPAPLNAQKLRIASSQAITSFTVSPNAGQTMNGAPSTMPSNGALAWVYYAATTKWYRIE